MIHDSRTHILNDNAPSGEGKYVLYWMQASPRVGCNHALEYAVARANELNQPLVCCFGLMDDYPEANERSYAFLLQGLADVARGLKDRGILFVVKHGPPAVVALHYGKAASVIVCDWGYLRHQKAWRHQVADESKRQTIAIETDVVIPVEVVSDHHEFAARTIRPKIHKHLENYLVPLQPIALKHSSLKLNVQGNIDPSDPLTAIKKLKIDRTVPASRRFIGGETQAQKLLHRFIADDLSGYATDRNEPAQQRTSLMSAYLHFGHISPLDIALSVRSAKPGKAGDVYLEELIVRRELSMNFCNFEPRYDSYEALPEWARKTLADHRNDPRDPLYTFAQLEQSQTHDPYWNAAQTEMVATGFMHNYMRMYWGKKILEWSKTPQEAFSTALALNNKYELDGRDANSFANIAWIFGLHDRPWGPARKIFGLIRYMNAGGLERKFDIDKYVHRVAVLAAE